MIIRRKDFEVKIEDIVSFVLIAILICEVPRISSCIGILGILHFLSCRKIRTTSQMGLVVLLGTLYMLLNYVTDYSLQYRVAFVLSIIGMYIHGYSIMRRYRDIEKFKEIIKNISIIYLAYVSVTVLNSLYIGRLGIYRNPINVWNGQVRAATQYGIMLVFPIIYSGYNCVFENGKKRFIGIIMLAIALFCSIETATRTPIFILIIEMCLYMGSLIIIKGKYRFKLKCTLKQFVWMPLILVAVICTAYNIDKLRSLLQNTAMAQRIISGEMPSIKNDGRIQRWLYFWGNIEKSLLGGGHARQVIGYVHNTYFDTFDLVGIIPFFILLVITAKGFVYMYKIAQREVSTDRILICGLSIGIFLQLMLEPVMDSVPTFIIIITMYVGLIDGIYATVPIRKLKHSAGEMINENSIN